MTLIELLKKDLKQSIRMDEPERRDLIRVVLGELDRLPPKQVTNEKIVDVLNKLIVSNNEILSHRHDKRLVLENEILQEYLPKYLTTEEIMSFFLLSDNPEFEQIRDAKAEGQAVGIAMKTLKAANKWVRGEDVKVVVQRIREVENDNK